MVDKDIADFNHAYEDTMKSLKLPPRLQNDYRIVDCLKESDNKKIYLLEAKDRTLLVLKIYNKKYTSLLENEYQIIEQLDHENHCPVPKPVDYWTDENYAYFLREYIAGSSLLSMYESGYFESDEIVIRMSMELCRIIENLHSETPPIIHRDIKPENFIWNKKDAKLYLIDCDSARSYKDGQERDTIFLGTPAHAAPEAYGYAQCDVRSDVYGIGKTMLYMCCGRADDKAVVECSISKDLHKIIKKCVSFSPEDRYPQVKCICHDLQTLYRQKYQVASRSFKRKYMVGLLVAAVLAFFLGLIFDRSVLKESSNGENQVDAVEADTTLEKKNDFVSGEQSLAETSDRITIDVSGYKDQVDEIITCYYEMDLEGMGAAYDSLFTQLYAAEDLQALEWTDISKLDKIPDNYPYKPYPYRVCDPLACYDQVLYTKIGHFEDYSGAIYGYLDYFLNEDTAQPDNPFYQYCNGNAEVQESTYKEALVELINCAIRGVMDQDELEFLNP